MSEPLEESGYRDARRASGPPPERDLLDTDRDDLPVPHRLVRTTTFPGVMTAAGILWILAGVGCIGLFGLIRLLGAPTDGSGWFILLGAAFFIADGVQLILGRFRDPLTDGILSILIGVAALVMGFVQFTPVGGLFLWIAIHAVLSAVFFVPGILALVGRRQYLAWKAEHRP